MKHGENIPRDKWLVTCDSNHASRATHHFQLLFRRQPSLSTWLTLIVLFPAINTPALTTATDAQGNPYQAIVGRNVFSLKPPPPPPNPEDLIKNVPPPQIK